MPQPELDEAPAVAEGGDEAGEWVWTPAPAVQEEEARAGQEGWDTAHRRRTKRKRPNAEAEDATTATDHGPPQVAQDQDVIQRSQKGAISWMKRQLTQMQQMSDATWQRGRGRGRRC